MKSLKTIDDVHDRIMEYGFLPFFSNDVPGFSIEDQIDPKIWFSDLEGPWEWKPTLLEMGDVVYGKFFGKKAGYVSLEWFPYFANLRRDGYDFDAGYDDGLYPYSDKAMLETIEFSKVISSMLLKEKGNFRKGGNKGFDTILNRLMMNTYVCIDTFEYKMDKHGNPYGWGIARYTTPERKYGKKVVTKAYREKPETSKAKILDHVMKFFPSTVEKEMEKLIVKK